MPNQNTDNFVTFASHSNVDSEECVHTFFANGQHLVVTLATYWEIAGSGGHSEAWWRERLKELGTGYDAGMYLYDK